MAAKLAATGLFLFCDVLKAVISKSKGNLYYFPKSCLPQFFSKYVHGSQPAITRSKLIIETQEQGVKYVQS